MLPLVFIDRNKIRCFEVWSKLPKCAVVGRNLQRKVNGFDTAKIIFIEVVNHFPKRFRISSYPYRGAEASSHHQTKLTDPAFAGSAAAAALLARLAVRFKMTMQLAATYALRSRVSPTITLGRSHADTFLNLVLLSLRR